MDGNFTIECKSCFKACRIVKGDSLISGFSASLVVVLPIFGSAIKLLEGKSFSKALKRSITSPNFPSISSDVLYLASTTDFNASSVAINNLFNDFISPQNG